MTLLEIFEQEIEKLGGYRATYHIIKVENSNKYMDRRRANNYLNSRRRNKLWKPSEIKLLRENMNRHTPYLCTIIKRSANAIRFRKVKERKLLCLTHQRNV